MTSPAHPDRQGTREELAAALPPHQTWCHGEAHAECCGAGDCDCGVADALDALLPVVERLCDQRAAEVLEKAADEIRAALDGGAA